MHRILQRVRDRMDDQGLLARLPVCGAIPLRLLTMCFLKWVLNYAAGKSECLMTLRGKGAKAVREHVFVADKAILTVEYEAGSLSLRVVDAYKHMGGIVASSGSQCRELLAWVTAMNSGVAALDRPVLSKHEVRLEDKLQRGHSFCSFTLARGRDWAMLSSKRCTVRACTFSDVPPTCTEAGRMRMRPIEKFWWPLDATPSMCKLQCCVFCSSLVWCNGEQRHFLLCCRLEMGTTLRGLRRCFGISLGSTGRRDPANCHT